MREPSESRCFTLETCDAGRRVRPRSASRCRTSSRTRTCSRRSTSPGIPLRAADRADDRSARRRRRAVRLQPRAGGAVLRRDPHRRGRGGGRRDRRGASRCARRPALTARETLRAPRGGAGRLRPVAVRAARDAGRIAGVEPLAGVAAPIGAEARRRATSTQYRSPICPVVPFMDVVHDRARRRGPARLHAGCRFCQAGMVYRPVRERSRRRDRARRDAPGSRAPGYDEVSLTSLSTTDHSQIEEVAAAPDAPARGHRRLASRCRRCASTRSASRWRGSCRRARRAGSRSRPRRARSACATSSTRT